jgi:hypothetical protein
MLIWLEHINFWMWGVSLGVAIGIRQRVLAVIDFEPNRDGKAQ